MIYIIIGVIYLLYSIGKKAENKKTTTQPAKPGNPKPVNPPVSNPLEEILNEIKRKQAEQQQKGMPKQQPKVQAQPKYQAKPAQDILVHEKKKETFVEGVTNYSPEYTRDETAEDKIARGTIRLANEGIYRIETIEEAEAKASGDGESDFQFDARQGIISSIILERKF